MMSGLSQSEGGYYNGGQSSSAGNRREQKHNSIRAVTIKQLKEASEDQPESGTLIDGAVVEKVKIVGKIAEITNEKTTYTGYKVQDGTGVYEIRKWNDRGSQEDVDMDGNEVERPARDAFEVGQYVAIFGLVKVFANTRSLNAQRIRLVTDFNEIIYHQLEALNQHLIFTNQKPGSKFEKKDEESLFVNDRVSVRDRVYDIVKASDGDSFSIEQLQKLLPDVDEFDINSALESWTSSGVLTMIDTGLYSLM